MRPKMPQPLLRRCYSGGNIVLTTGIILISLMVFSVSIDVGYMLTFQNRLQTVADAAALASTMQLINSTASNLGSKLDEVEIAAEDTVDENMPDAVLDPDSITVGYVDPTTKSYDAAAFATPPAGTSLLATGGYNAVRVAIKFTEDSLNGPLSTIFAKLFAVPGMETEAYSVGLMDQSVIAVGAGSGLRPIYACQNQVNQAFADGNPRNNVARVYGQRFVLDGNSQISGCPELGTGNWGFADLRDCDPGVPGANDTAEWFRSGYTGTVESGRCYSTQSGNFLTNSNVRSALDQLIADQTVILLPVIDTFEGTGSNTEVTVSSFVGFVITGYSTSGSANQRYIEGYFTQALCRAGCTTGNVATGPGVAVVKLRLAADESYEPQF